MPDGNGRQLPDIGGGTTDAAILSAPAPEDASETAADEEAANNVDGDV